MALSKDELGLISKKLSFGPDYIRFRSVCKSWRSAAPKRLQTPWLIATNPGSNTYFFDLYRFSFETNKLTRIPELLISPLLSSSSLVANSAVCIGSSHGWLALFNRVTSSVLLCNPLTNSSIVLPNLQNQHLNDDTFSHENSKRFSFSLTSDPGDRSSDCFALIYCSERILYCKIGANVWIVMAHLDLQDIHFCAYREKYFMASSGDVFVCDFGLNPGVSKIVSLSLNDIETSKFKFSHSYLVESDGDLLLLLVYHSYYCDEFCCDCGHNYIQCGDKHFRVLKLDFGCQLVKLVELKNLGAKSLFLSEKNVFCLTANRYPGCKENSVYSSLLVNQLSGGCYDFMSIFDFDGRKGLRINDKEVGYWDLCSKHGFWFAPSLLS